MRTSAAEDEVVDREELLNYWEADAVHRESCVVLDDARRGIVLAVDNTGVGIRMIAATGEAETWPSFFRNL
mgnify:CR=1 FL=1